MPERRLGDRRVRYRPDMQPNEIFLDAFGRVRDGVHRLLSDADEALLTYRPDPEANSVVWLIWHLTRVLDDHVMDLAGREQVWRTDGWAERFDLPFIDTATGYGHISEEVAQVRATPELLVGYHDATQDAVAAFLRTVTTDDLDRVIDEGWDPPVTMGVRLVSVIGDTHQHLGQAAYVSGLHRRR